MKVIDSIRPALKAVVAFLVPGLGSIASILASGREPTPSEWLIALGLSLSTAVAVYQTPNDTLARRAVE